MTLSVDTTVRRRDLTQELCDRLNARLDTLREQGGFEGLGRYSVTSFDREKRLVLSSSSEILTCEQALRQVVHFEIVAAKAQGMRGHKTP